MPTPISPPRTRTRVVSSPATAPAVAPAMAACVVGVAKEIVEAQTTSGAPNASARVSVAASVIGTDTGATKDLSGLSVRVVVNGDATTEVNFPTSPSNGEISARLAVNTLDSGISGVSVSKDATNQTHFVTTEKGDGASLKFLRAKVRITHGAVTNGPFVVGQELEIQGTANVVGTVSAIISSTVTIVDLSGGTVLPVASDVLEKSTGGSPPSATVVSVHSAYDALGITEFETTVEGASSYRNRSYRISLDTLPTVKAATAAGLIFDTDTLALFRAYGGRLYELGTDFATLRSRSHQSSTTTGRAKATYPSGSPQTNTTVTYTTVGSTNGSEVAVAHRRSITIVYDTLVGTFTAGKLLYNTTPATPEIVGIILSDDGVGSMVVAMYGVVPANNDAITDGTATAAVDGSPSATAEPICRVESRLFRLTLTGSVALTAGGALTNQTVGAGQYAIGTILHVSESGGSTFLVVKLGDSGYPATVGSIVGVGGTTGTVTAITDLGDDKLVVSYAGNSGVSAALVAEYINRTAATNVVVKAEVGGASPGSGNVDVAGAVVTLSPISLPSAGTTAEAKFTGYPWDDRDGDSRTPYFWARGALASASFGTGVSAITFTAKGGQDLTATGNYHGVAGNSITVEAVDAPVSVVTVTVSGTAIRFLYRGPTNSSTHTAADIVTAINAHATAGAMVVASTATGTGSPTGWCVTALTGGRDPINFLQAPAAATVYGERTAQNFGYIRVDVASVTGFTAGETIRLTGASGAVVGILREVDSTNNVLWVDPTHHNGIVANGAATPTLDIDFAPPVTSYLVGWNMRILTGTGSGTREITAYTSGRVATVASAWATNPATSDTYIIEAPGAITDGAVIYGVSSTTTATVVDVVQAGVAEGDTLELRYAGGLVETATFTATTSLSTVLAAINAAMTGTPAVLVGDSASPHALLTLSAAGIDATDRGGIESIITIGGTAVEKIFGTQPGGRTFAGTHEGVPFKAVVGDELWSGTTRLGRITAIATATVGSQSFTGAQLKIDTDTLSTTTTWTNWWIRAKNLTLDAALDVEAVNGVERPTPGLRVDVGGNALLVHQAQARRTDGVFDETAQQPFYVDYDAVRTDLSGELHTFDDLAGIEEVLYPVSPENPLAWGIYCALLNSNNRQVQAVAVNETTTAYPLGTILAFEEAMSHFNDTTYAVVPLTRDRDVLDFVVAENESVAQPADSSDTVQASRIICIGLDQPSEGEPTLVASGTGTLTGINTIEIDPDTMNVVSELVAAGYDSPEDMTWADFKEAGVYLTATTTKGRFSISAIDGQVITVVTDADSFEPDDNDDSFYSESDLDPDDLDFDTSGESVSLRIRGAAIDVSTTLGRTELVEAIGTAATVYASKRVRFVQPDIGMVYNGATQIVPSYFGACMLAGAFSGNAPHMTYFNHPLVGAVSVSGSNDTFTPTQMNLGAGYGIWWLEQPTVGGPVVCRDQVTTLVTDTTYREHSIVQALDWFERLCRTTSTRGPDANITESYLQAVALSLNSCAALAQQADVLQAQLTGVSQNAADTSKIDASFSVQVKRPARELNITITV